MLVPSEGDFVVGAFPLELDPQHSTTPLEATAHVWEDPALTEVKVLVPSDGDLGVVGACP